MVDACQFTTVLQAWRGAGAAAGGAAWAANAARLSQLPLPQCCCGLPGGGGGATLGSGGHNRSGNAILWSLSSRSLEACAKSATTRRSLPAPCSCAQEVAAEQSERINTSGQLDTIGRGFLFHRRAVSEPALVPLRWPPRSRCRFVRTCGMTRGTLFSQNRDATPSVFESVAICDPASALSCPWRLPLQ